MKGIITSVLLAGCIICSASCKKELGYTGFESDRNETFTGEVVLSTDKAIYSPGESVTLTASTVPVGKIYIRYRHLGETVKVEAASSATWTWQTPAEDYMGYMVEMYQITDDGEDPGENCQYVNCTYFPDAGKICLFNIDFDHPHKVFVHQFGYAEEYELEAGEFMFLDSVKLKDFEKQNDD